MHLFIMNLNIEWEDIVLIVIGAAIGFIGSVLTIIAQKAIDKKGEIKIYYKFSNVKSWFNGGWGFEKNNSNLCALIIPICFEFQNTSNTTRVIRDVSLSLYNNSNKVCRMLQINKSEETHYKGTNIKIDEPSFFGGPNETYSFVLPPTSIQKQKCEYIYHIGYDKREDKKFNKIVLSYFDEKDKVHSFEIREIEGNWEPAKFKSDYEWTLATRN